MSYDFIIVGAGSAGCVVANRLSSDPSNKVLLIEAGTGNRRLSIQNLFSKIPAAMLSNLKNKKTNWLYPGQPEPHLNNRKLVHDRGKGLGGSSSINGMVFIRGHALDYENWGQLGCKGWSYSDVLPYFKKMEAYSFGDDKFRGRDGLLHLHRPIPKNPLDKAFLKSGTDLGYLLTEDINGHVQEGFGVLDRTIYKGERWSTKRSHLDTIKNRTNLTILSGSQVNKILFKDKRAIGISFNDHLGTLQNTFAKKEVILCAGAIGSPHLLMLSGIGPKSNLQKLGVDIILDLPGVGRNLQDHPDFILKFKCKTPISVLPQTKGFRKLFTGVQWILTRKGLASSNHFDTVACIRSHKDVEYPDLQLTLSPLALSTEGLEPLQEHAFQIHLGLMRPFSRGFLELESKDPCIYPRITVNYLDDNRDIKKMLAGIKIVRSLVDQKPFIPLKSHEIFPGPTILSHQSLVKVLRSNLSSQWHLVGTCKMGQKSDNMSVVREDGSVHGLNSLRIVDASIMPSITNGNTNSPTIMIAEKLSHSILKRNPLTREDPKVYGLNSKNK